MDDKVMLWRLGILVLSTILVGATLILYLGRGFQPTYRLYLTCNKAPNVTPETPIQRNGVLIGRVETVDTLPQGGVEMVLRINKGVELYTDEVARIGMTSLLGESIIEFVPGRGDRVRELLVNNDKLTNDSVEVSLGPMDILEQAVGIFEKFDSLQTTFQAAGDSVKETSENIGAIAESVKNALGADADQRFEEFFKDIKTLSTQASATLKTYDGLGNDFREVIGDPMTKSTLKNVIRKIPDVVDKADAVLASTEGAIKEFRSVAENANIRLNEIGEITKPLADEEFVDSLRNSLDGIGNFLSSIKDSKGTIGLLLNDPSVYNRLDNGLRRMETITYQLEPILKDVRVFTSKISTDPRMLGVKGALDRRPSGTGIKGLFLAPQYQDERETEIYYE